MTDDVNLMRALVASVRLLELELEFVNAFLDDDEDGMVQAVLDYDAIKQEHEETSSPTTTRPGPSPGMTEHDPRL